MSDDKPPALTGWPLAAFGAAVAFALVGVCWLAVKALEVLHG